MFGSILFGGKCFALLVSAIVLGISCAGTIAANASAMAASDCPLALDYGKLSTLVTDPIAASDFTLSSPPSPQVASVFLEFYNRYGGLRVFGLAVTGQVQENGLTVQYYERE